MLSGLPDTFQVTGRENWWQLLITQQPAGGGKSFLGACFDLISVLSRRLGRRRCLLDLQHV